MKYRKILLLGVVFDYLGFMIIGLGFGVSFFSSFQDGVFISGGGAAIIFISKWYHKENWFKLREKLKELDQDD